MFTQKIYRCENDLSDYDVCGLGLGQHICISDVFDWGGDELFLSLVLHMKMCDKEVHLSRDLQWKVTNPGEQISSANCSDNALALVLDDKHFPRYCFEGP